MNETTTITLSAIIFTIVLLLSVMVSLSLLRTNTELEEKLTDLEQINDKQQKEINFLYREINSKNKEIEFQKTVNKTFSEGLEAFTNKSKK